MTECSEGKVVICVFLFVLNSLIVTAYVLNVRVLQLLVMSCV
jgi:hypothetical protein